jgi:hypothetical protein
MGDMSCEMVYESKGERECRRVLETYFGKPFPNVRPAWLTNPKTGKRLEIDCLNESIGIGIEYDGIQHYKNVTLFGNNIENQRELDLLKEKLCYLRGIILIRVPCCVKIEDIERYIKMRIPNTISRDIKPNSAKIIKSIQPSSCRIILEGNPSVNRKFIDNKEYDNFNDDIIDIVRLNNPLILFGRENLGKTSLAKFILDYKACIIERLIDIFNFDSSIHDGIIFKNIDLSEVAPIIIMQFMAKVDRRVRLYGTDLEVVIPGRTKLIFTTREPSGLVFGNRLRKIYRECQRIMITKPTYYEESDSEDEDVIYKL